LSKIWTKCWDKLWNEQQSSNSIVTKTRGNLTEELS
jgi:hypothetical protein